MPRVSATPRGGQDRWLLSYADLVTLLFAVFTTLYAASSVDAKKTTTRAPVEPVTTVSEPAPDALSARLSRRLEAELRLQRADILRDGRGLVVSLPERAAFAVGSAEVSSEARRIIGQVVAELGEDLYALRVEGHTDDQPISTARFASNWELSTARAGSVVAFLIDELGVRPDRLSAAGYGEFHPVAPNDSDANRAKNRRIDIVVLPARAERGA